jgi:hypothetical protein
LQTVAKQVAAFIVPVFMVDILILFRLAVLTHMRLAVKMVTLAVPVELAVVIMVPPLVAAVMAAAARQELVLVFLQPICLMLVEVAALEVLPVMVAMVAPRVMVAVQLLVVAVLVAALVVAVLDLAAGEVVLES